jgi:hypothetical protein
VWTVDTCGVCSVWRGRCGDVSGHGRATGDRRPGRKAKLCLVIGLLASTL